MSDREPVKQFRLERRSAAYLRVALDNPPLDIFGRQRHAFRQSREGDPVATGGRGRRGAGRRADGATALPDRPRPAARGAAGTQARIKKPMERGFHDPGDVETRLGHHAGQLGS